MISDYEIGIILKARDEMRGVLSGAIRELDALRGASGRTGAGLNQMGGSFRTLGGQITATAGNLANFTAKAGFAVFGIQQMVGAAGAAGNAMFGFNARAEQTKVALTTLLRSGEGASAMLRDLQKFAAQTPFEFPELAATSQKLLAFGFAAKDIIPTLTSVGDAVSAMGKGSYELERVATILGQIKAKGKLQGDEVLQLAEAGINAWDILSKQMGKSTTELQKMSTAGKLFATDVIPALVQGFQQEFGGAMEAQSKTFFGMLSTLRDNANATIGRITEPAFDVAKGQLEKLVAFTNSPEFSAWADDMAEGAERMANSLADFLTNEGPALVKTFGDASSAALNLGGDMAEVVAKANAVNDALGGEGWKLLLAALAGGKIGGPLGAVVTTAGLLANDLIDQRQKDDPKKSTLRAGAEMVQDAFLFRLPEEQNKKLGAETVRLLGEAWDFVNKMAGPAGDTLAEVNSLIATQAQITADAKAPISDLQNEFTRYRDLMATIADNTTSAMKAVTIESDGLARSHAALWQSGLAVNDTMSALSQTYQVNLGFQSVLAGANSEYKSQIDAIKDAKEAVIQKQKEGNELTGAEWGLITDSNDAIGRLTGGMRDNTIQRGLAAMANVQLMSAQDALNGLLREGTTDTQKLAEAQETVEGALRNARIYGLNPNTEAAGQMNESMARLQGVVVRDLVPAIQNLIDTLNRVKPPPEVRITVENTQAMDAINSVLGGLNSIPLSKSVQIYVNYNIAAAQAAMHEQELVTRASGSPPGGEPRTVVAKVGELGPELAVYPYAGAFAAGGTVGMVGTDGPEYRLLPRGTHIVPADKTKSMMRSLFGEFDDLKDWHAAMDQFRAAFHNFVTHVLVYGDELNDWLSHLPEAARDSALAVGRYLAQVRADGDTANDHLSDIPEKLRASLIEFAQQFKSGEFGKSIWDAVLGDLDGVASGEMQHKLKAQLAQLQRQLAVANDLGLGSAIVEPIEAAIAEVELKLIAAGAVWGSAVAQGLRDAIPTVEDMVERVQNAMTGKERDEYAKRAREIGQAIAFAQAAGWGDEVIAALQAELASVEEALMGIGHDMARAISAGLLIPGEWRAALSTLPGLINGGGLERLRDELRMLDAQLRVAKDLGAPQEIIDEILKSLDAKRLQVAIAQRLRDSAADLGLIEAVKPLKDGMIEQLAQIAKDMPQQGAELIGGIVAGIQAGRLSLEQALTLIPATALDGLQRMEEQITVKLAEAILSNSEDVARLNEQLAILKAIIESIDGMRSTAWVTVQGGALPGGSGQQGHLYSGDPHYSGPPVYPGGTHQYAEGGWIREPVVGVGMRSGARYTFAENEAELVTPGHKVGAGVSQSGGDTHVYVELDGERIERRINVRQFRRGRRAIVPGERF